MTVSHSGASHHQRDRAIKVGDLVNFSVCAASVSVMTSSGRTGKNWRGRKDLLARTERSVGSSTEDLLTERLSLTEYHVYQEVATVTFTGGVGSTAKIDLILDRS